jgi:large subunit ribosomal protein L4
MASDRVEKVTGTLSVPVVNRQGQSVGSVSVDAADFGGKISRRLLHDAVLMYQANQRAGTHSTLRRGEVAGSTKKLFRQKGTGNARVGTRRTNKRRGGGTAKGPKPRDYEYHLPKKALQAATRMAILSKLRDKEALVVDDLSLTEIGTKLVAQFLKALGSTLQPRAAESPPSAEGAEPARKKKPKPLTFLIGTDKYDPIVYKSARNIAGVEVLPAAEFNSYVVLRQKRLLLTRAALDALRKKDEGGRTKTAGAKV